MSIFGNASRTTAAPRLAAVALGVGLTGAASIASGTLAHGYFVKYGVTIENFGPNASQIPHTPPWPLEQRDAFEPPIDPTRGFWLFANENGRVRAFVSTRSMQDFAQGGTFLHWRTQLTKQPNQVHTFTLNRSWLRVNGVTPGPNGEIPEASLWFSIVVEGDFFDVHGNRYDRKMPQLEYTAVLKAQAVGPIQAGLVVEERFVDDVEIEPTDETSGPQRVYVDEEGAWYYEIQPYTGTIDIEALSWLRVGARYTISYEIYLQAQNGGRETLAEAFLGDPLDPDGGLILEPGVPLVIDEESGPRCETRGDEERFVASAQGTILDRDTGLEWQRCPAGFTLNGGGTPGPADDRCELSGQPESRWPDALSASVADRTTGRDDWRVPNLKELDSIVELSCGGHVLRSDAFPLAPAQSYWTSTPDPLDATSVKVVNMARGEIASRDKTLPAHLRLVRTAAEPLQPRATLSVYRTSALEGGAGGGTLSFPIVLSEPVTSNVTVRYDTLDLSALAGEDYAAASGTVTIPAGSTRAVADVGITPDSNGEAEELLWLQLSEPSTNARIERPEATGLIRDDEPRLRAWSSDVGEAHGGESLLDFRITLDRPSDSPVSVRFTTSDGTATAGEDYTTTSTVVTIPTGARFVTANLPVAGDRRMEADESILVTLSDPSPNVRLAAGDAVARMHVIDDDVPALGVLNDTGILNCGDLDDGFLDCPAPGFPGQDAQFGRDLTDLDDSDGVAGFSFTKLDSTGAPLVDQSVTYTAMPWDCVRDEVTGLVWEEKTRDGGLRDRAWAYSWFNSTGANDGGSPGTPNAGSCVDGANCDTEKYVAAVNAAGMCGFNDWRLPTREELRSIVAANAVFTQAALDLDYFPNVAVQNYWTSTPRASQPGSVWIMSHLGQGATNRGADTSFSSARARLVRGGN